MQYNRTKNINIQQKVIGTKTEKRNNQSLVEYDKVHKHTGIPITIKKHIKRIRILIETKDQIGKISILHRT